MKTKVSKSLEIEGLHKFTQQISPDGGASIEPTIHWIGHRIEAGTERQMTEKILDFLCGKDCLVQFNAGDQTGRIDVTRRENEDGVQASVFEVNMWRKGLRRLWIATYVANVEVVTRKRIVMK